ncbi:MAG: superoxide dismutase [Bacteroidales bacterium]|nr:superoxide dismutase [Bacteroidales bacterium]
MKNIKHVLLIGLLSIIALSISNKSYAHCEIPCGIYEDTLRIELIKEHIVTIEKSMNMITKLSGEETPNYNQIIRWVNNKEEHANKLQDIVTQYFLNQRIKPVSDENSDQYKKYTNHLTILHKLLVFSMKAKQTTDLMYIDEMNQLVNLFEESYFHKHKH